MSISSNSPAARQPLRAVVGGSADLVSGAYEYTINLQSKGQVDAMVRALKWRPRQGESGKL